MSELKKVDTELAGQLSAELAKTMKPELKPFDGLSFFQIEKGMREVGELLELAIIDLADAEAALVKPSEHMRAQLTAERDEKQATLNAVEAEMLKYLASEIQKTDSVAGYYRYRSAVVEMLCKEEDRVTRLRRSAENLIERFKGYLQSVMIETKQDKIQGSTSWLRLQNNGGTPAVVITPGATVPDAYQRGTFTLTLDCLNDVTTKMIFGAWLQSGKMKFQGDAFPDIPAIGAKLKAESEMIADVKKQIAALDPLDAAGQAILQETLEGLHKSETQWARLHRGKHVRIG